MEENVVSGIVRYYRDCNIAFALEEMIFSCIAPTIPSKEESWIKAILNSDATML